MAKVNAVSEGAPPPVTVTVAAQPVEASPAVVGGSGLVLAAAGPRVADLPLYIQRAFIRKTLTLLLLQQLLMLGVAALLRFALPGEGIALLFPANSIGKTVALGLGVIVFGTIPLLAYVRDRHPLNLVATVVWTLVFSLFIAGAHTDGGVVRSYFFFVVFSCTAAGIAVMLVLCTMFTCPDGGGEGGRILLNPMAAGVVGCAPPSRSSTLLAHTHALVKPSHDTPSAHARAFPSALACVLLHRSRLRASSSHMPASVSAAQAWVLLPRPCHTTGRRMPLPVWTRASNDASHLAVQGPCFLSAPSSSTHRIRHPSTRSATTSQRSSSPLCYYFGSPTTWQSSARK